MKNSIKLIIFILIGSIYSCGSAPVPIQKKKQEACCKEDKKDSCKKAGISATSEITCPKCGHKKIETLPTEVCKLSYTCEQCGAVMHPKEGDCCVFCTYGDHKCPSKQ